jgi:hypothetical protein
MPHASSQHREPANVEASHRHRLRRSRVHRSGAHTVRGGAIVTYLRLLDANVDGADWREVSRIVLHIDAGDPKN